MVVSLLILGMASGMMGGMLITRLLARLPSSVLGLLSQLCFFSSFSLSEYNKVFCSISDPITDATASTVACNDDGTAGALQLTATASAGTSITAYWNQVWPHPYGPMVSPHGETNSVWMKCAVLMDTGPAHLPREMSGHHL